jgi:hypothetical protein
MNELDIARYFIAMLYLAMKQQINIPFIDIKPINEIINRYNILK